MKRFLENVLTISGSIFIALGIVGIFLPLLPTTPFLLLGASCYIKGSPKLYCWLMSNKWLGQYIKNYRDGNGIPLKTKVIAVFMLWTAISYSIVFIVANLYIRICLIFIAACVTWHILAIKSREESIGEEVPVRHDKGNMYLECEREGSRGEIYEE